MVGLSRGHPNWQTHYGATGKQNCQFGNLGNGIPQYGTKIGSFGTSDRKLRGLILQPKE